ncbi:VWA domain-containing protein, partial [Dermatophilus congolensis]|uniref:VWA domain-containing protein n=2 Tax=Dermatophilus congolensis TaxID=1863 RepID=UPI001AB04D09
PATCPLIPLAGTTFPVIPFATNTTNPHTPGRKNTPTTAHRGRYIRSRPARPNTTSDIAIDATIRAAAPHQRARNNPHGRIHIERSDWQEKIRRHYPGNCTIFIVDASGSMGAQNRMTAAKGAILSLLLDAYQKRNRVALITFHHRNAHILLPPTSSIELAGRLLTDLPIGGPTPLPTALTTTSRLLNTLLHKTPELRPLLILVSDGCANIDLDGDPTPSAINQAHHLATNLGKDPRTRWIVVDTENPTTDKLGHAAALAHALNAPCHTIDELHADDLLHLVHTQNPH